MTDRRFDTGDEFAISGMLFRIGKGRKGPEDRVLMWSAGSGWRFIDMRVVAMMVDFFCENEDALYPPANGFLGRQKFLDYIKDAADRGYEKPDLGLRLEKKAARLAEAPRLCEECGDIATVEWDGSAWCASCDARRRWSA